MKISFNAPHRYKQAIECIHSHGIFVEAGIILGFDSEDPTVFEKTLAMLDEINIDAIQVSILTPLPGTALYNKMKDRIIDHDWEHYDFRHVVYMPQSMRPEELRAGVAHVIRKFYSLAGIARRIVRWISIPGGIPNMLYPLVVNCAYYGRVQAFHIR